MPEQAFTRREPGKNPIALELDRLAEQIASAKGMVDPQAIRMAFGLR